MIRVTVWNEYVHEKTEPKVAAIYPDGIHKAIADFLGREENITVRTATLEDESCGITRELLDETDVLVWWGHMAHHKVPDEIAYLVRDAVLSGMGLIALHSAHHSKPFRYLLGTSCNLTWRESDDEELLWVIEPSHPITRGIDRCFKLEGEETYPTYYAPEVQTILCNAVRFLAPTYRELTKCPHVRKITDDAPYVI